MSDYVHHLPGRLRVRVPALKANEGRALRVGEHLRSLAGVREVQVNQLTGSVLILYDAHATDASPFFAFLNVQAHTNVGGSSPMPSDRFASPGQEFTARVAEATAWYFVEKALERSVPLLLAALL